MSSITCNYQQIVTVAERLNALADAACQHCGISSKDLLSHCEALEVCADEFSSDIASGHREFVPIALCPSCHKKHHLDARNNHNPCQVTARDSRERLD